MQILRYISLLALAIVFEGGNSECSINGFWHPEGYDYVEKVVEGVISDFPSHGPGTGTMNQDGTVHWIWHNVNNEHHGTFSDDCSTITWENNARWFREHECSINGFWHPEGYDYVEKVVEDVISDFPSHGPGTGTMNQDGTVHWIWHNVNNEHHGTFSDDCSTITWENNARWFRSTGAPIFDKLGHGECISDPNLDIGEVLGQHSHTIHIKVDMPESHDGGARQWILNLGQKSIDAHHWIWNSNENIQFGTWGTTGEEVKQITDADIRSCSSLTTTYGDDVLNLYCNGVLIGSKATSFNIQSAKLAVGKNVCPGCATPSADFQGCVEQVKIWNRELSADEVSDLSAECSINGFWHPEGYDYDEKVVEGVTSDFPSHGPGTGTMNQDGTVHWIWHNVNNEHHGTFSDDCSIITWENNARWFRLTVNSGDTDHEGYYYGYDDENEEPEPEFNVPLAEDVVGASSTFSFAYATYFLAAVGVLSSAYTVATNLTSKKYQAITEENEV